MIYDANEEVKLAILIVFMEDKCLKTIFGIFSHFLWTQELELE